MIRHLPAILSIAIATSVHARQYPAVDSSTVARAAWREAETALARDDLASAARAMDRAVSAWPTQIAYQRLRALIAARRNDDRTLTTALVALAALEAAGDIPADTAVERRAGENPAVAGAVRAVVGATRPLVRSTVWQMMDDTTLYAEGIATDPASGHVFLTSIRHRTVYELDGRGEVRDLGLARQGAGAVMAVRVAPDGRHVWAVTAGIPAMREYGPPDSTEASLLRIRRDDGQIVQRWNLAADGQAHVLGDVAIGPAGDVFVTDSRAPLIFRLPKGGDTLERITHPLFRSLQGIVPDPGGRQVYVADYSHGVLRVDLETGAVLRLADAPGMTSLGLDGLGWYHGSLFGVQNGVSPPRVICLELSPGGDSNTRVRTIDRNIPLADEPTALAFLGDRLVYVANSQWEKYDATGMRRPGTRLAPTAILVVPLSH